MVDVELSRRTVLGAAVLSAATSGANVSAASMATEQSPIWDRATRSTEAKPIIDYLSANGSKLLRSPQGSIALPSVSPSLPGREYSAQLWDWDTLWTSVALFRLAEIKRDVAFHAEVTRHVEGSLLTFFAHQTPEGRIPLVINPVMPPNGGLRFDAPNHQNQAKPVFGQLALLLAERTGSVDFLAPHFAALLRFYDSWYLGNLSKPGLLVWGDDVSIGNDNDPTTYGRPYFSSANVLLNCFFYQDLGAAEKLAERLNRPSAERARIAARRQALGEAIQRHCWDARDAFYYTADVQVTDRRAELIPDIPRGMATSWQAIPLRIQTFTGFLPLWCGLATPQQAEALLARNWFADERLRGNWGVRSLGRGEPMYSMVASGNPSNWLGPVWIIANYLVWKGLVAYGQVRAADDLATKTVRLLVKSLAETGSLNEYYHPDTGVALSHQGFMDWDMLVLDMI